MVFINLDLNSLRKYAEFLILQSCCQKSLFRPLMNTDLRTRCAGAGLRGVGIHNNLLSPTDGHGFTLIFARAALVLACIAGDLSHTDYSKFTDFADCSAPAASGMQSYLTQNSRKSRRRGALIR